eukprot:TRINITY_DN2177_c1_g1_i1.p1 TRINITY_DN2177_c1_g1~~TRINITY_DN2177_c1_g1_i1.p1  ORF type:complete len:1141 (+),score=342.93 TRINITY_DN2177_c1_g1_i1:52-3474(+)
MEMRKKIFAQFNVKKKSSDNPERDKKSKREENNQNDGGSPPAIEADQPHQDQESVAPVELRKPNKAPSLSKATGKATNEPTKIEDKEHIGDYLLIDAIGRGGYGIVYKGLNAVKGNFVAIKKIHLGKKSKDAETDNLMMEIKLLQKLRHSNIVKYVDHILSKKAIYIVMEYMEIGSLQSMVKRDGIFPEFLAIVYVRQILNGLDYLHQQGVIHRDIKAANILLSKNGNAKLADFGVASHLKDLQYGDNFGGTPYWMAPEVIQMQSASTACDVWSMGCTVIELLTGYPPYHNLAQAAALFSIVSDDHPPLPEGISNGLRDFLMRCFKKDEHIRITCQKLLEHPWIMSHTKPQLDLPHVKKSLTMYKEVMDEVYHTPKSMIGGSPTRQRGSISNMMALLKQKNKAKRIVSAENLNFEYEPVLDDRVLKAEEEKSQLEKSVKFEKPLQLGKSENFDDELILEDEISPKSENSEKRELFRTFSSPNTANISNSNSNSNPISQLSNEEIEERKYWSKDTASSRSFLIMPSVHKGVEQKKLTQFQENDDVDDLAKDLGSKGLDSSPELHLRLRPKTEFVTEFEEQFDESDVDWASTTVVQDKFKDQLVRDALLLIDQLSITRNADVICNICGQLMETFKDELESKISVITKRGILPILVQLSSHSNYEVILALLQLICQFIGHTDLLEAFCLLGCIPIVSMFSVEKYTPAIRLEVSRICKIWTSTTSTLQIFIGCRNFTILVNLLESDYAGNKEMVHHALDCILRIFRLQTHAPKATFCALFCQAGLMEKLSKSLRNIKSHDMPHDMQQYFLKLAETFLLFSQTDVLEVKQELYRLDTLKALRDAMESVLPKSASDVLPQKTRDGLLKLLKSIKTLCADPARRDLIVEAGLMPTLVTCIDIRCGMSKIQEIKNQALTAVFLLCQLSKKRNAIAAESGIVEPLKEIINGTNALRELALSIYFNLSHAGMSTRELLWKAQSLEIYLQLLSDENYYVDALDAIATWLASDVKRVEKELQLEENLIRIRNIWSFSSRPNFTKVLQSLLSIASTSATINRALSASEIGLVPLILKSLQEIKEAHPRLQLLKILNVLFLGAEPTRRMEMVGSHRLGPFIRNLIENETGVMVLQMAEQCALNFTSASGRKMTI